MTDVANIGRTMICSWLALILVFMSNCKCKVAAQDVRLVGGITPSEGRVEVLYNSVWGTVCDDGWDLLDASVVCRQLGYASAVHYRTEAHYGEGSGTIWLDNVHCRGSENSLAECSHNGWGVHDCSHSEDAGAVCEEKRSLRLVNGNAANEGRVEVFYNGEWGTICDDEWDYNDASVACMQLGFSGFQSYYSEAHFGPGTGRIWLDNLDCDGDESRVEYCRHKEWGVHNCQHSEDAGLKCSGSIGDMRLAGFDESHRGRVEVYYNDEWGTVCANGWGYPEAEVVCRGLGYDSVGEFRIYDSAQGFGSIWLDEVDCEGIESSLAFCTHSGWGDHDCTHAQDVAVSCKIAGGGFSSGSIAGIVVGSLIAMYVFYAVLKQCQEKCHRGQNGTSATQNMNPSRRHNSPAYVNSVFTLSEGIDSTQRSGRLTPPPPTPSSAIPSAPPPSYESIAKYATVPSSNIYPAPVGYDSSVPPLPPMYPTPDTLAGGEPTQSPPFYSPSFDQVNSTATPLSITPINT